MHNCRKAPPAGKRSGRLLAAGFLSVICSASSTSAAIVLSDDNRTVVTSSHNLLAVILLFALLFVLMAALWIIRTRWFHKRARHKSETASPERKATTNQTSSHDKPTE
jgi:ABC-type nickel/cobalt efflux system permease component RcnA